MLKTKCKLNEKAKALGIHREDENYCVHFILISVQDQAVDNQCRMHWFPERNQAPLNVSKGHDYMEE